jgi:predicted ArsR family transcriptional regulator
VESDRPEPGISALGTLTDPVRRAAYRVVSAASAPVGRDDVAAALGIGRTLAAHHLDRLVDAGLLEVSFARRSGRSGPGAGRPAKLYSRAPGEHSASVPPRSYRWAGALLAEAVERAAADDTLHAVARDRGAVVGRARAGVDVVGLLTSHGYEPQRVGSLVRLRNCPFHLLAEEFPPLVCGMNLALVTGLLDGAGLTGCTARLDPAPGRCCVAVEVDDAEAPASKYKTD